MLTKDQTALIEKYFSRCNFDDECDFCQEPQFGSYCEMAGSYPGSTPEVNFYICGKCAVKKAREYEDEIISGLSREIFNESNQE